MHARQHGAALSDVLRNANPSTATARPGIVDLVATRPSAITEPPPGLRYVPDFVSEDGERALVSAIETLPFEAVVMRGVVARRTVVHYGRRYGYEPWSLEPAPEPPAFLGSLRERAAVLARIPPEAFAEVLVTRYPPGAPIGWHRDAPYFGPAVVGVSLIGDAVMRFRRTAAGRASFRLALAPRSAYVLAGAARATWQHSVSPVKTLRYSVTFRTLRAQAKP
jgi:alkylated DNA repair dioxygenase AlkB